MLEQLKKDVYEANMELQEKGMVIYTWGNVSGIDREHNYVVIKPSGVEYDLLKPEDMVVVDFDGNVVEGKYRPSSDTPTHIELYKAYPDLAGVVHTHSTWLLHLHRQVWQFLLWVQHTLTISTVTFHAPET